MTNVNFWNGLAYTGRQSQLRTSDLNTNFYHPVSRQATSSLILQTYLSVHKRDSLVLTHVHNLELTSCLLRTAEILAIGHRINDYGRRLSTSYQHLCRLFEAFQHLNTQISENSLFLTCVCLLFLSFYLYIRYKSTSTLISDYSRQ